MSFYTEVIEESPLFNSAEPVSDMGLLEPTFRRKVSAVVHDAANNGVRLKVMETYRSEALQERYFKEGNTEIEHVGVHHWGLAADLVPLDQEGNPTWDYDAYRHEYNLIYKLAKLHGLVSGVDWGHPEREHKFRDRPHVQRVSLEDQDALFAGEFYPDENYDPYA